MQIADLSEIRYKNPLAAYQHNKIAFKFLLKTKTEKMAKPLKTSANTCGEEIFFKMRHFSAGFSTTFSRSEAVSGSKPAFG